ncbi:YrhC family protein [Sporolactobacillus pectinivorans]|uniref:YrhC family protein n=1 Tax=Sporolactobacillus pectinivorans TaxID=1591408 RepID=UPI000C26BB8A|nr:YrhC family protein [Sporolactobacillus pectinivorans]
MKDYEKIILEKIKDCRRIGFLCLFLSTFLYAGTLIPKFEEEQWKFELLTVSSLLFILLASLFYWRTSKLREKLDQ